jgi:hypothetical protein
MSASQVQAELGIPVSSRQFRRYIAEGIIPARSVTRNRQGHFVLIPPPTPAGWQRLSQKIQNWREGRFSRGWSKRSRKGRVRVNAADKSVGIVTIEGIHQRFLMWKRKVAGEVATWNASQLERAIELLKPMWIAEYELRELLNAKRAGN